MEITSKGIILVGLFIDSVYVGKAVNNHGLASYGIFGYKGKGDATIILPSNDFYYGKVLDYVEMNGTGSLYIKSSKL